MRKIVMLALVALAVIAIAGAASAAPRRSGAAKYPPRPPEIDTRLIGRPSQPQIDTNLAVTGRDMTLYVVAGLGAIAAGTIIVRTARVRTSKD